MVTGRQHCQLGLEKLKLGGGQPFGENIVYLISREDKR
jgi:hypothetical protein